MSEEFATFDRQHLTILHQAIGDDFEPLIPVYFEQSDNIIHNLNLSYEVKDMELLIRSAHSLRSSSYSLGAFKLSEYSRQLEEKALANVSYQSLGQLIKMINDEYPNVKRALQDYQDRYQ